MEPDLTSGPVSLSKTETQFLGFCRPCQCVQTTELGRRDRIFFRPDLSLFAPGRLRPVSLSKIETRLLRSLENMDRGNQKPSCLLRIAGFYFTTPQCRRVICGDGMTGLSRYFQTVLIFHLFALTAAPQSLTRLHWSYHNDKLCTRKISSRGHQRLYATCY